MNQPAEDSETPKKLSNDDLALDRTEMAKYRSLAAADRTLIIKTFVISIARLNKWGNTIKNSNLTEYHTYFLNFVKS